METLPSVFVESKVAEQIELPPRHNQMARMAALGFSPKQICEKLDISSSQYTIVSQSPLFKAVVADYEKECDGAVKVAQNILIEAAPKAAQKLVDTMDVEGAYRLNKEAAHDVLKGVGAIRQEIDVRSVVINIDEKKLTLINQTLKELK
jgi:hypothetical protein